jgi:GNAT superfamily N-acetyltransferase
MNIFFSDSSGAQKNNMETILPKGDKTIQQLQDEIQSIPNFCREEYSLQVNELKYYLNSGITLYAVNNGVLSGVLNFEVNKPNVNIIGLCVPKTSSKQGVGAALLDVVKKFSEINNFSFIKLSCYGSVVKFYTNNGFRIQSESEVYDSDEDEDEDEGKTKYDMLYTVISGGKKRRTRKKKHMRKSRKQKRIHKKSRKY